MGAWKGEKNLAVPWMWKTNIYNESIKCPLATVTMIKCYRGNTLHAVTHRIAPILGALFYFSFEGCYVPPSTNPPSSPRFVIWFLSGLLEHKVFSLATVTVFLFWGQVFNQIPTCLGLLRYSILLPSFLALKNFWAFHGHSTGFLDVCWVFSYSNVDICIEVSF